MEGYADMHVFMMGGGEGALPPSPYNLEKKILSEEILTSFTYVLLIKLRGNRYTIHGK